MSDESPSNPPQPGDTYFVPAGTGRFHALFPGVDIRTSACERMMISVVNFAPESVVPDHAHPHEQMGYMVSGHLEFNVGGEIRILSPGDVWKIPGGVRHTVRAVGGPAVALDVFNPIREDYL